MSMETYKAIGGAGVRWFCKRCDKFACAFMSNLQKLSDRQDKLESKFETLEVDVQNKVDHCQEKIEKIEQNQENVVYQGVADSAREIKEREIRKNNIVILGLPMCV